MFGKRKHKHDQRKKSAQQANGERVVEARYYDHDDALDDYGSEENEEAAAAVLWAMEDEAAHRWDQDEEVDYDKMKAKSTPSKQNPILFTYSNTTSHKMGFLGTLKGVQGRLPPQDGRTDLLEVIDTAQRQGRLPWMAADDDNRYVVISRYGMKVTDVRKQQVHMRHPLHHIAGIIFYEDGFGRNMLAFKIGEPREEKYDVYIYECESERHAKDVCLTLAQAFDAVYQKATMEQSMTSSRIQ